jgi:hypothetical protein
MCRPGVPDDDDLGSGNDRSQLGEVEPAADIDDVRMRRAADLPGQRPLAGAAGDHYPMSPGDQRPYQLGVKRRRPRPGGNRCAGVDDDVAFGQIAGWLGCSLDLQTAVVALR